MWIIFSLLAALSAAIVVTLSKAGIKNVDSSLGFAIQSIMILIVSWSVIAWQGKFSEIAEVGRGAWFYLLLAGIITCLSSLLMFAALKLGDASRVSPLSNLSLAFSVVLATLFLKERITWQTILGAGLMAIGALVIATASGSNEKIQQ